MLSSLLPVSIQRGRFPPLAVATVAQSTTNPSPQSPHFLKLGIDDRAEDDGFALGDEVEQADLHAAGILAEVDQAQLQALHFARHVEHAALEALEGLAAVEQAELEGAALRIGG